MLKQKYLFTFLFSLISLLAFSQEICDNGIDDDGDNLIDLNDTECSCNTTLPFTFVQDFLCNSNFGLTLTFDCPGATSYQWYQDGIAVSGETTNTIVMFEDPALDGEYVCIAQKPGGCVSSESHTVDSEVFVDLGDIYLCAGDTVIIGAFAITEPGTWQGNNKLDNGCDSITRATIFIEQREIINLYDQICSGGTYTYNGKNYSNPGDYVCYLPNIIADECDTLVRINLTYSDVLLDTIYGGLCSGESFFYNSMEYTTPGWHELPITNPGDCDSLVSIFLTASEPSDTLISESICSGESIVFCGNVLTASGSYICEDTNVAGCDSTITMVLTVNDIVPNIFSASICEGDTFELEGISATTEGMYSDTITAPSGCDSIITVNLTFTPPSFGAIEVVTICESSSIIWGGMEYSTAGLYYDTIQAMGSSCDSINTLDLSINNEIPFYFQDTICEGDVYILHSINTTIAGEHMTTIPSAEGCDSVITVNLIVGMEEEDVIDATFCEGASYNFGALTLTSPGTYYDTLETHLGCDSTIVLNLGQLDNSNYFFRDTICFGDMFTYHDIETDSAGMHETMLTAVNGCDSLVTIELTVNPLLENEYDAKICAGDFYDFGDTDLMEEGTYERRFSNAVGCDSIITINLTVVEPSDGVNLGDDIELNFGLTTDIYPDYLDPNLSDLQWTDQNGIDLGTDDHVTDFGPLVDTYVYFSAIDENGCLTSDTILVRVDLDIDIYIPNTFSPNGDDANDNFDIFSNPSVIGIKEIQVYDRWGELMYQSAHPATLDTYKGWDGRFKDTMCKPGVFVYSVTFDIIDGSEVMKAGTITLVR